MALMKKLRDRLSKKSDSEPEALSKNGVYNGQDLLGYKSSATVLQSGKQPKEQQSTEGVGFDKIYSLEKVDLTTVRKMKMPEDSAPNLSEIKRSTEKPGHEGEENLNFGLSSEGTIESLRLSEPIQVLGLSDTAEKKLLEGNKKVLKDLLNLSQQKYALGQGHIDEIQSNLEKYLKGSALYSSQTIDYLSILHKIFADLSPLTAYFVLKSHHIEDVYPLSQSDKASLSHMQVADKKAALKEALSVILKSNKVEDLEEMWKRIINAFVIPWMRTLQGLASKKEIRERLVSLGVDEMFARKVVKFLESTYFKKDSFMQNAVETSCDKGVYCIDKELKSLYEMILQKARTYFYRPRLSYELSEIAALLYREFARSWNYIPENLIERVFTLSPYFRVRKGINGLTVRLH